MLLSESDYIRLCIEAEKQEAKPGWEERIKYFEDLLIQNKYISSVKDLPRSNILVMQLSQVIHIMTLYSTKIR